MRGKYEEKYVNSGSQGMWVRKKYKLTSIACAAKVWYCPFITIPHTVVYSDSHMHRAPSENKPQQMHNSLHNLYEASPMIKSISTKMSLTLGGLRAPEPPSSRISTALKQTL